ncbi:MAG: aspartate kinase [Chloracidobacterium sp.]|uniref:Aspartokinase n=1 Tax=Chloracidobacterium validum TaxID=2821543 RepID=A0ABX8BBA9_9BACT|nr:aspartate kinase [Chloracidobacterium validum]QUW04222.1 aspartate kinase [Chloracidobacterium validum]
MNPTSNSVSPASFDGERRPTVMKFGGTSVQDTAAFARVAAIARRQSARSPLPPVVVVSAMAGMTDALLEAVRQALEQDTAAALDGLEPHFARYSEVAESLTGGAAYGDFVHALYAARERLAQALETMRAYPGTIPPLRDEVVAYGEQLAATLLAAVIAGDGTACRAVDARTCIVTDEVYGRARPRWEATVARTRQALGPVLSAGVIPVLGGFIGATLDGATTTLGRGGSDYSATLIGAALQADEVQIWTDVAGIYSADPRLVARSRRLETLAYGEATDLALYGAKVLHPRTIEPVERLKIPVSIRNSYDPDAGYSMITSVSGAPPGSILAVTHRPGIAAVHVRPAGGWLAASALEEMARILHAHGVLVEHLAASRLGLTATVEQGDAIEAARRDLASVGDVHLAADRALLCVVGNFGEDVITLHPSLSEALAAFQVTPLLPHPSAHARLFLMAETDAPPAVQALHARLVEPADTL